MRTTHIGVTLASVIAIFTALAANAQSGGSSAQSGDSPPLPEGVTVMADIPFANVEGHELALDLYKPTAADNPPVLVWVHGGAWRAGSRKSVPTLALVEQGYALASTSYRLSGVASFPAQSHDIKAAIRFLRAHEADYGYDASRIGILGSSAGAHLAALVGVTNGNAELEGAVGGNLDQSSDVHAIVAYYPATNLVSILDQSTPFGLNVRVPALEGLLGGPMEESAELARLASPVFHVDADDPPLFLLHGDQDPQMPINQSHELHGVYKQHGLAAEFEVVHGSPHGGPAFYNAARNGMVGSFLDEHLRSTAY